MTDYVIIIARYEMPREQYERLKARGIKLKVVRQAMKEAAMFYDDHFDREEQ